MTKAGCSKGSLFCFFRSHFTSGSNHRSIFRQKFWLQFSPVFTKQHLYNPMQDY